MENVNSITERVIGAAIAVHKALGPGLLESVYEEALFYELNKRGHKVLRQVPIDVVYDGQVLGQGFRADLIVDGRVIVELKSVREIVSVHKKQLLTYLKLSGLEVGLLMNFSAETLKDGLIRVSNNAADIREFLRVSAPPRETP